MAKASKLQSSLSISKLFYTLDDIKEKFQIEVYNEGRSLYSDNHIKNIVVTDNLVSGFVEDKNRSIYFSKVEKATGIYPMSVSCTCRSDNACRHITAVLFEGLRFFEEQKTKPLSKEKAKIAAPTLDSEIVTWLDSIAAEDIPISRTGKCIAYVILPSKGKEAYRVRPISTTILKNGGLSQSQKPYSISNMQYRQFSNYVTPEDKAILYMIHNLVKSSDINRDVHSIPMGPSARLLLNEIMSTGLCYWKELSLGNGPLQLGEEQDISFEWQTSLDGMQKIQAAIKDQPDSHILPLKPMYYVCPSLKSIGIATTTLPENQAIALLLAPKIKPEFAKEVTQKLAPSLKIGKTKTRSSLLPTPLTLRKSPVIKAEPRLKLSGIRLQPEKSYGWSSRYPDGEPFEAPVGALSFDYDGIIISGNDPRDQITKYQNEEVLVIPRNKSAEFSLVTQLYDAGLTIQLSQVSDNYNITDVKKDFYTIVGKDNTLHKDKTLPAKWETFVEKGIPRLKKMGWKIEMDLTFPHNVVQPDDEWYAQIGEDSSGIDWFGIELGVNVDGERLNLIPILLNLLKSNMHIFDIIDNLPKNKPLMVNLDDGRKLALPAHRAKALLTTLQNLFTFGGATLDENGMLRIQARDAALLAEMEAASQALNMRWVGGDQIRKVGARLKNLDTIKNVTPPKIFKGELRPYQQEGLNWLQFLREFGLAGILADDMGLGKTVQLLAHITVEKAAKRLVNPILVIAPTSLMVNWRIEAEKFAPDLKVLTLHGPNRKAHFKDISKYDLVLTTYPLLTRDKDDLIKEKFHSIILDEAQIIKNARAKITQIANQLKASYRLCMTGTPLENHLGELWSLFNFLLPGYLGKSEQFRALFRSPIEKHGDMERAEFLAKRVKPFMLRRTKKEVVTELPSKTEIIRRVELEGEQRDLYETIRVSMHEKVRQEIAARGVEKSHIIVLDALLKLRQVCCDPALLKSVEAAKTVKESAKLDELMDFLPQMIEEGRKILLFSQFTSMLSRIEDRLTALGIEYVMITGQTKDRETPVREFQEGKVPLFLISLKAGGTGLNLTAADTVIHYDPWWNPAVEDQATDRAYRIGQDKPVFVYKMITTGTVEDKILDMQEIKRQRANILFDPREGSSVFSVDDIQALFEPLGQVA